MGETPYGLLRLRSESFWIGWLLLSAVLLFAGGASHHDVQLQEQRLPIRTGQGQKSIPDLVNLLDDTNAMVRVEAAKMLGLKGKDAKNAVPALMTALTDEEWLVRLNSATALRKIGVENKETVTALVKALYDENESVRLAALDALGAVGPSAVQNIDHRKIYIIGKNHIYDQGMSKVLYDLALEGKIVLGDEGTVRNPHFEAEWVKTEYGNRLAVIYGIENERALKYSVYLLGCGALTGSIHQRGYMMHQIFQLIKYQKQGLMTNDWDLLAQAELSKNERELFERVNAFMAVNKHRKSPEFMKLLTENKLDANWIAEWMSLLKRLVLKWNEEIAKLPAELRPNMEQIGKFIESPADGKLFEPVFDDVNIRWRNKFISNNMREVVDIAIEKDLPVYIYIGSAHVLDLAQRFGSNYRGMNIRVYGKPTRMLIEQIKQEAAIFAQHGENKSPEKVAP